jgi:hypothetical protein
MLIKKTWFSLVKFMLLVVVCYDPIFGSPDSKVAKAPGDLPAMEQKGRVAEPIQRSPGQFFSAEMRLYLKL